MDPILGTAKAVRLQRKQATLTKSGFEIVRETDGCIVLE